MLEKAIKFIDISESFWCHNDIGRKLNEKYRIQAFHAQGWANNQASTRNHRARGDDDDYQQHKAQKVGSEASIMYLLVLSIFGQSTERLLFGFKEGKYLTGL